MRVLLPLAMVAVVAVPLVGCGDANSGDLTHRVRRGTPAPGAIEGHDDGDLEGANDADEGNANASGTANAPATLGQGNAQFSLALSANTPTLGLQDSLTIDVTVEGKNGFNSPVAITVAGLPPGASAAPVTASAGAPAKLVLATAATAVPTTADVPLVITGTASGLTATANANFKIAPRVLVTIPVNVQALGAAQTIYRDEYGAAFGATQQVLRTQPGNGIVVSVFNADSKPHIVHGVGGFQHGNNNAPIPANSPEMNGANPRTRTFNVGASGGGYPHDMQQSGPGASFRIKVEAAP
jgi:hypothetical protein